MAANWAMKDITGPSVYSDSDLKSIDIKTRFVPGKDNMQKDEPNLKESTGEFVYWGIDRYGD